MLSVSFYYYVKIHINVFVEFIFFISKISNNTCCLYLNVNVVTDVV